METRKHIAAEKLENGTHNCAQAIICTYADLIGIDEETSRNLGNAFGSGMGNMEGTCGALVGAGIVLGLATKDKAKARKAMRQIMTQFQQRNGATTTARGIITSEADKSKPIYGCKTQKAAARRSRLDVLLEGYSFHHRYSFHADTHF